MLKKVAGSVALAILSVTVAFAGQGNAGGKKNFGSERSQFRHVQNDKAREHRMQQKQENAAFRGSLGDMTGEERQKAMAEHRARQKAENEAFSRQMHEENMAFMKQRLNGARHLTDAQKEELIGFYERQNGENVAFREQQYRERVAFFEKIAGDATLTQQQRKDALSNFVKQQKTEYTAHRKEQGSEAKTELLNVKGRTAENGDGEARQ